MMENPCQGCGGRRWDCHAACGMYHAWKEAKAESERAVREGTRMDNTLALIKQQGMNKAKKKKNSRR